MTSHDRPWHKDPECRICFCHGVSYAEIVAAIQKGAKNLDRIKSDTLASTGCSGCECDVIEILSEVLEQEHKKG